MNYDFLEIGTSCFDTLLETAKPGETGLSVEPLKFYLDRLPDKIGCVKIPVAISTVDEFSTAEVFYVPENVIRERNLPHWLLGCNSIGEPHLQHRNQNLLDVVQTYKVRSVPIRWLFETYAIESVKTLKIDTEGCDAEILLQLHNYIITSGKFSQWPKSIRFESNALVPADQVRKVIQHYTAIGYTIASDTGEDTVLIR
jgi:hypothetical protein